MTMGDTSLPDGDGDLSGSQLIHAAMQFLRIFWYRRNTVIAVGLVVLLLASLYYATAQRRFASDASLLILQTGHDDLLPSIQMAGTQNDVMPTYKELLESAVVLQDAAARIKPEHRVDFGRLPEQKWANVLAENLKVSTVRKTKLLNVSYESKDPAVAAAVITAVIEAYIEFIDRTHKGTAAEIIDILTREKTQLEDKLAQRQQELLKARQAIGDFGMHAEGANAHPVVQTALRLNDALIEAQKERLDRQAMLAAINASVRNGEDLKQHILAIEGAVGRQILMAGLGFNATDARVQSDLERAMLADHSKLATITEHYGPAHPRVTEIRNRIHSTQQYIAAYRDKVNTQVTELENNQLGPMLVQMIQQSLAKAWQHEKALRTSFEQARAEAVQHEGKLAEVELLGHDVNRLRRLHDILVEQIASTDLQQEQGELRATIVKSPKAVNQPIWPRLSVLLPCSMFVTFLLGGLIVYVQDIMDDRFRSQEEMSMRLGVQILAIVGELPSLEGSGLQSIQSFISPNIGDTEAFRTLRTTLAFSANETERLVVSSAEPGDGKTTVLANLAVSYAQSGRKTLLIDADLRRPGMTNLLGLKGAPGLSDVLYNNDNIADMMLDYVQESELDGLDVLPSGPRRPNPAELLTGARMGELLAWADGHYDQILLDSPPVLAASDSLMLGRLVDGAIIVVRPDKNRRRAVTRAVENFRNLHVEVLGIIPNCVNKEASKGYGFEYGYGYSYNYGYGEEDHSHEEGFVDDVATVELSPNATLRSESDDAAAGDDDDMIVPRWAA